MKVFLISSSTNISLARKLFSGTRIKITNSFGSNILTSSARHDIAFSDAIVAIIDEDTPSSPYLMDELNFAISVSSNPRRSKNPILIPILIKNATLPDELKNALYISCNPQSSSQIKQTKKEVLHLLQYKPPFLNFFHERKLSNTGQLVLAIVALFLGIVGLILCVDALITVFNIIVSLNSNYSFWDDIPILFSKLGCVVILLVAMYKIKDYLEYCDNYDIESYSERLKETIVYDNFHFSTLDSTEAKDKPEIDALGRMLINLEDIKEYYTWSQKQAKSSFYFAVSICIFGFLLLATAVIIPFFSSSNLEASVISAIGGIISELIACTALIVYKNSLTQLNHYHQALHEDERFLSSINLLNRFSTTEAQDEMLKELIRSEIQMNLNAATEVPLSDTLKEQ